MTFFNEVARFIRTYLMGVVAAAVSTFFAGYMLIHGEVSEEDINIVVRHNPVASPLTGRLYTASIPKHFQLNNVPRFVDDQLITGSVSRKVDKSQARSKKENMLKVFNKPLNNTRPRYKLKIATAKIALVEGNGKLWSVSPGRLLPGFGRVLRIRQRGRKWIVVTTHGEIK